MADRLDVAGRLIEGAEAIAHTEAYVRACQAVGYDDPALTARPGQIRDWYRADDGLDLHVLDADCAELRAADAALTEALRMQRAQADVLAAAWSGPGADAAAAFLRRHCDAAQSVVTGVRAAAQQAESLRDDLWRLVDAKVAAAVAIDARVATQRPGWLAAAAVLASGTGDRAMAHEIVSHQVKPYVDNDIRGDWVSAMRSAQVDSAAAYDVFIDRLAGAPRAFFEIPGDLGPAHHPPTARGAAGSAAAPVTVTVPSSRPAAAAAPSPLTPTAAAPAPTPASAASPGAGPPPDLGAAWGGGYGLPGGGLGSSSGGLGGGSSGASSGGLGGLGALAGRIVAALTGLANPDGLTDAPRTDGLPDDEDPSGPDEPEKPADKSRPEAGAARSSSGESAPSTAPAGPPVAGPAAPAAASPVAGGAPPAASPAADPPPPSTPSPGAAGPCEIAANELPQAGQ